MYHNKHASKNINNVDASLQYTQVISVMQID